MSETFRMIPFDAVVEAAEALCGRAASDLPADVLAALAAGEEKEQGELGRDFFRQYRENAAIAARERLPLCQDTGFAVWFVEYGDRLGIDGGTIHEALDEGTRRGYKRFFLRKSILKDPVFERVNTFDNTPAVVHLRIVPGTSLRLVLAPKGGGSENMSALRMLRPADGKDGVADFIVDTVRRAGGNPCPPTVVGVGLGGTMEVAAELAKRALLRPVGSHHADPRYAAFEDELLARINATGVGPQGLGGSITSLAVHIETHPCHLASLPVAVNLNCHAARHAEVTL